jgi:dCMP deaminase
MSTLNKLAAALVRPVLTRPQKDEYYLSVALMASQRATCMRRRFGAVLVPRYDRRATIAFNGAPGGVTDCLQLGSCWRRERGIPPGSRYECCRSVHAEANALLFAEPHDSLGSTLYIAGVDAESGALVDAYPCVLCTKLIMNAGVVRVVVARADGSFESFSVEEWKADPSMLVEGLYGNR